MYVWFKFLSHDIAGGLPCLIVTIIVVWIRVWVGVRIALVALISIDLFLLLLLPQVLIKDNLRIVNKFRLLQSVNLTGIFILIDFPSSDILGHKSTCMLECQLLHGSAIASPVYFVLDVV